MFQYSFCSYSTHPYMVESSTIHVSIQLLFLFNFQGVYDESFHLVSIQLLFLFNYLQIESNKDHTIVSIQLLFLFNISISLAIMMESSFNTASVLIQPEKGRDISSIGCFNTASVLIQRNSTVGCIKYHYVSIQLLFLFNWSIHSNFCFILMFQYSFCSYSTYKPHHLVQ